MTNTMKQDLLAAIAPLGYEVASIQDQGTVGVGGTVQPMLVQNLDGTISQIEQTTIVLTKKTSFVRAAE